MSAIKEAPPPASRQDARRDADAVLVTRIAQDFSHVLTVIEVELGAGRRARDVRPARRHRGRERARERAEQVQKPFTLPMLLGTIRSALDEDAHGTAAGGWRQRSATERAVT
jgi:hypothetical protein